MSSLYSRSALSPFTRANAEQVNAELAKIQSAIDALQGNIADIVGHSNLLLLTADILADEDLQLNGENQWFNL